MSDGKRSVILSHALRVPAVERLRDKRVVLASKSPRRRAILNTFGLAPEIVPSEFPENLTLHDYEDLHEYPVATASHKAVEVYERLVREQPHDGPDLVIAADTVVLTHVSGLSASEHRPELLEKPLDAEDNMRMLLDLNGGVCEVVTGVCIVYPILTAPGYETKRIDERSLVHFSENPPHLLKAYVDSGEGLDCAGGFNVGGNGALLTSRIEGDYHNVVGFPAASFFKLLDMLLEEDDDFLAI